MFRDTIGIVETLIDVDAAGGTSNDAAAAIAHSLKGKLPAVQPLILAGTASDSGGGGTGESLLASLRGEGCADENTRWLPCSLHNVQTPLRNAVEEVFGKGGSVERVLEGGKKVQDYLINAMQLMNGIHNIFSYLDIEVLKLAWEHANERLGTNVLFHKITNPVLTRWWLVGTTACELDEHWEIWKVVMEGLVNLPKGKDDNNNSGNVVRDIAAANVNLMTFDEIRADIKIIGALHTYFVFPHFAFLQGGDPVTFNKAGYQGRLIAERYFLMHQDLSACENNGWKELQEFEDVNTCIETWFDEETKSEYDERVGHVVRIMTQYLEKHFDRSVNKNLPFALFSSATTAQVVAKVILRRVSRIAQLPPPPPPPTVALTSGSRPSDPPSGTVSPLPPTQHEPAHGSALTQPPQPPLFAQPLKPALTRPTPTLSNLFSSPLQKGRTIHLCEYMNFLEKRLTMTDTKLFAHQDVRQYCSEIEAIALGYDMWDRTSDLPRNLDEYRVRYLLKMAGAPTTTQMTERSVKKSNHVDVTNRSDQTKASYALANNAIISENAWKKKSKKDPTKEFWARGKEKGEKMVEHVMNMTNEVKRAKERVTEDEQKKIHDSLHVPTKRFRNVRVAETFQLYRDNFDRDDLPQHKYAKRTKIDKTALSKKEVLFKKMTVKGGFKQVMLEEIAARKITLTPEEQGNYTLLIKRFKKKVGSNKSFKPVLPFERFKWW